MTDGCGEIFTDFVHYHITNCPVDAGSVEDTRYPCEVLTNVTYVDKIKMKLFIVYQDPLTLSNLMFTINIAKDIVNMGKLHILNLVLYDVAFAFA